MKRLRVWGLGLAASVACAQPEALPPTPAPTPERGAEPQERPEPPPVPAPRAAPVVTEAARAAHATAQRALEGGPLPDEPLLTWVPIAPPTDGGSGLERFHASLRALERGEDPDGRVRIGVYGSSSTAADRWVAYLRRYLQARFGDGGPGFVAVVPLWKWHRHDLVKVEASKHWLIEHAQKKKGRLDGRYGLLGASAATSNKRARASLVAKDPALRVTTAELWFLAQPDGGRATLHFGGKEHRLDTRADRPGPGYHVLPIANPTSPALRIQPKGDGEVRLFGVVLERADPGVVVDNLGIGGTRAGNQLAWDEALWRDGVRRRGLDLYVLAYGANESIDEDEPIDVYREALKAVLQRWRQALPQASCVLMGPQDYPKKDEAAGKDAPWLPRPRLGEIIAIQRDVAAASGCGFFDLRAMMGGEGAMQPWVAADPQLAKDDHLHLTPLGYHHLGRVFTDALMADYDAS